MKIAIIGDHPCAQACQDFFKSIEATVTRYNGSDGHKKVLRIQKRFYSEDQGTHKQRFHDLFRVVFDQDPEKEISKQLESEGKEVFEKLTEFELNYLKSRFEGFEDFDLIVNLPVTSIFSVIAILIWPPHKVRTCDCSHY